MQKLLEKLPRRRLANKGLKPKILLDSLSQTAGVYIFYNDSKIIYVGKAINLKRRISSYFDLDLDIKTTNMINDATHIGTIKVSSELEALLLEAKLIRSYMPHYNIAAKDDKHPLYIAITDDEFPRIISCRKPSIINYKHIYGPFPSSANVYTVLRMLRRIFPYSDHKIGKRACIYSHIGLCDPCPNEIELITNSEERKTAKNIYLKNIRSVKSVLDGKIDKVTKDLDKEMNNFAKTENYEEATKVRDQIEKLVYITRPQMPTEFYLQNPNLYEDARKKELKELQNLLTGGTPVTKKLTRIECYDIAHLSGTNATASMVTFINGEADNKLYRHFQIRKAKGGDDYASLTEVAQRRSKHFDDWGIADIIIVDGGIGQIEAFKKGISAVPVIGIAKHPDRLIIPDISDNSENSDRSEKSEGFRKIRLEGPALNLVSRMRDEAHRFARRHHHKLVQKSITNPN